MVIEGLLAYLMVKVYPKTYRKCVKTNSKGKPLLYAKTNKNFYGLLRSILIYYKKLLSDLEVYGFTINPYNPCVDNKDINGYHMTILCHVGDLKISHKDYFEVTSLTEYLTYIYGWMKVNHMKVQPGTSTRRPLFLHKIPFE